MSITFAKNLKIQRKLKRVSQDDLSIHLNVARSTISAWENNISEPNLSNLVKIAKYLDIPYKNLLD